jgi:uncharacterized protein YjbI with pentapeptide repeats
LGAAAVFALAVAAAALLTGKPLFAFAGWTLASLPIVYLVVAAVRGKVGRLTGTGAASGLILVVSASTVIALTSCGQRLEPGADLSGCDLTDLQLAGLDLSGSDLTQTNLSGVDLRRTDLNRADLSGADLRGATVDGASLRETKLDGADLRNLDLTRAIFHPVSLAGAALDGANLSDAELVSVSLVDASAVGANLTGANLSGADLTGATLEGATLDIATLVGTTGLDDGLLAQTLGVTAETLGGTLSELDIRLEPREDVLAALGSACAGGGVSGAAAYPQGDFHPMVILDERGEVGSDTDQAIGLGWEPMAVRFAQLVACVSEEEDVQIEHCPYTLQSGGAANITRVRHHRSARVVEAATGRPVLDETFEGSNPVSCPLFHEFVGDAQETFEGGSVGFNRVQTELSRLVE